MTPTEQAALLAALAAADRQHEADMAAFLDQLDPSTTPTVPWVLTDDDRALLDKLRLSGE